ncbi:glycosyltransferase [Apibacter muscae]|uniref:Glycosyltransferase n=1 Tax=Apibacter muscae TaxID=2509004 RepID=A0A563DHT7_9FLAO|nr:glycosyltransferase family 4 protein [Apibacter muscae]TWP29413.1 glycosyltransferase [Apibacter muscae]
MKILFVTQNYTPSKGGMAESCKRITKNLKKSVNTIHIFHFNPKNNEYIIKPEKSGYYVSIAIHHTEEYTLNLASLFLEDNIHKLKFDLIVAFGGYLPLMWAPIISQLYSKPLYTFIRGNDFDEFLFSKKRDILFYALQNSTGICSVSKDKQKKISNLFPEVPVYYTPNGIDLDFWELNSYEVVESCSLKKTSQNRKIILLAGQLKFKKGIVSFFKDFEKFPYKEDYEVWLVGDITDPIKEIVNKLSINIQYFPFTLRNQMKIFYKATDIVCIPSFYDGMPNVLLEAGASHKFIIAAKTGGMPDVITHKQTGLLYNPLKNNDLLEVLLHYHYMSEQDRKNISESLYSTIKENFTEQNETNNYLTILKS